MRYVLYFSLLFVIIAFGLSVVTAAAPYVLTDLGDLPGGEEVSPAAGINSFGQVVGQSDVAGGVIAHAYLWTPNAPNGTTGSMIDLGTLPSPYSGRSEAIGINGIGQVVGGSGEGPHAFLWSPTSPNGTTGSMVDLGDLPGGVDASFARGINSLGQVVGEGSAALAPRAFLWTPSSPNSSSGSMVDLGELPGGDDLSSAAGINFLGQVVGDSSAPTGLRGFLWTPTTPNGSSGSMINLGDLPGGSDLSEANAINSTGQVVGASNAVTGQRAFLWTPNTPNGMAGSMIDLGDLPGGSNSSRAHGINSLGHVVGNSSGSAFVWTPSTPNGSTGTMVDLNTLLMSPSGNGWRILGATAINDAGQIAGLGMFDPDGPGGVMPVLHGILLTPVLEPATLLLMMTCLGFEMAISRCSRLKSR